MIAINGFLLTTFPPIAIMVLLGLYCLKKRLLQNYILVFIAVIFLFMMIWRIPFVNGRRYVLPVVIPSIPIAVLFLKTLYHKRSFPGQWLCGIMLIIITVAGTAKAMRFQEPKPYLKAIPAIIHRETQTQNWQQVGVIILGNIGGYLQFTDNIISYPIMEQANFQVGINNRLMFRQIDKYLTPDNLLLHFPALYIILSSNIASDEFIETWQAQYGHTPKLCYDFTQSENRQETIKLFRIESPYISAYKNSQKQSEIYEKFNLLNNPDFSQKQKLPVDSPILNKLTSLGIDLTESDEEIFIPNGWQLYMPSLKENAHVSMKYSDSGRLCLTAQNNTIALLQTNLPLNGGKIYQLHGCITIKRKAYFIIDVQRTAGGKWDMHRVCTLEQPPGKHEFYGLIDLSNEDGIWNIDLGITNGEIELDYLYLVNQTVFN